MKRWLFIPLGALLVSALPGCPGDEAQKARPKEDFGEATHGDPHPAGPTPVEDLSDAPPEVSRSLGHKGSLIVLWPRVINAAGPSDAGPPPDNGAAEKVQQRLAELAHRAAGARAIDVRPAPETTCAPKNGCDATSIGAVLVVKGADCAVAAVMAGPNKSAAHLLPWSGKVEFAKDSIAFGESPEPAVKVKEFVPCESLLVKKENEEATLARYIAGLMPKG
jgi:hypothetical protein